MRDDPTVPSTPPTDGSCSNGACAVPDAPAKFSVSRRSFIKTMGVSAAAGSLAAAAHASGIAGLAESQEHAGGPILGPDALTITLTINGKPTPVKVEPATTLLETLRIHLNLTGSKEICDRGACGGCSVIMDGKLVNACMTLAVDCVGSQITTVEGIGTPDALDPVQVAFVKHDAMQCGYCTPGFVVASRSLLNNTPKPTLEQIKRGLGGNICRCGTYTNIFNAVLEASGQSPVMEQKGA
jgi:aerobic-type carbon monoxide dehydrogenase small subunit (CoxS/CutS family)